jgi:hypothetical protein
MDNIIHVNFAKRHAVRKADQRLRVLDKKFDEGLLLFTLGTAFGVLVMLGFMSMFTK